MAEASHQPIVVPFVEHVLPLARGQRARLEQGMDVIDVGCGGGRALLMLAERFPGSRFLGVDLPTISRSPSTPSTMAGGDVLCCAAV